MHFTYARTSTYALYKTCVENVCILQQQYTCFGRSGKRMEREMYSIGTTFRKRCALGADGDELAHNPDREHIPCARTPHPLKPGKTAGYFRKINWS